MFVIDIATYCGSKLGCIEQLDSGCRGPEGGSWLKTLSPQQMREGSQAPSCATRAVAQPDNDWPHATLVELASERYRFGYRRRHALVRREGVHADHNASIGCAAKLGLPSGAPASFLESRSSDRPLSCRRAQISSGQRIPCAMRWPAVEHQSADDR